MKALRALAVVFSLSCLSTVAYADKIDPTDFRFQVLDPPSFTGTIITSPTLGDVTFSNCPAGFLTSIPSGGDGCFFGLNATGQTITAVNLFFENTSDSPGITGLDSQPAGCETGTPDDINGSFTEAFGIAPTCSIQQDGNYELTYTMGPGVPPGNTLILVELDADPNAFVTPSNDTDTVTLAAATPEPDSIALLSTGVLCIGLVVAKRRFRSLNLGR